MTEGDFNAKIAKELSRRAPAVKYLKVSDRFATGVSDFLIWFRGTCIAVETKYINEFGSDKAKLLTHPFAPSQTTFLESIALTSNQACGIVGVGKTYHIIPWKLIPETGNWKTGEFKQTGFVWRESIPELVDCILIQGVFR